MLTRIKKLPDQLINRIAAGEVVERPASALKELLENSIDAKADKISIELSDGGIKQIKVSDNGAGICPDDLFLAIDRHATSKLIVEEDLYQITTLGFRGEGLASIASVSNFLLASKIANEPHGYQIVSYFGNVKQVTPLALNKGTIVEVNELYHNVPARKKFLKAETTEYGHCKNMFERIALSYPQIAFELKHNGKVIYQLPKQPLLERIQKLFGTEYAKRHFEILETSSHGLNISGYVYHPSYLSGSKTLQYFYINGRYVRDRVIQNAIKQGFSGVLHNEHQPQYVLFLDINPQEIDVNVHPTKSEVRFKEVGSIHSFISATVRKALAQEIQIHPLELNQEPNQANPSSFTPKASSFASGLNSSNRSSIPAWNNNLPIIREWLPNNGKPFTPSQVAVETSIQELFTQEENGTLSNSTIPPLGFALAQLNGIYILSQAIDGLIVVDMHAAHERIILEKLKQQLQTQHIQAQQLLVPITINITEILIETINNHKNDLLKLGFSVEITREGQLIVSSIPALLTSQNGEKMVVDLLGELHKYENSNLIDLHQEEILSTLACHSALRANHALNIAEMNSLLREMEQTQRASYCNHGRPTWFKLTMTELDSLFMRGK